MCVFGSLLRQSTSFHPLNSYSKLFIIPSLMRFLRPNVPILSQKLSFSLLFGVRGDFGRGEEAIFVVYVSLMSKIWWNHRHELRTNDIRISMEWLSPKRKQQNYEMRIDGGNTRTAFENADSRYNFLVGCWMDDVGVFESMEINASISWIWFKFYFWTPQTAH